MTTEQDREYAVRLDRDACDGIFACLVRDDRFGEADDGLATLAGGRDADGAEGTTVATFTDDRLADAEQAAAACPVGAIEVEVTDGE